MLTKIALLTLMGVACAASVEDRVGLKAEARDTGSSYSAPAQSSGYEDNTQGNLYYYYYPVQEYGTTDVDGGDFDIFTAIILPLLILGGLLLLLSSLTFTLTGGRALDNKNTESDLMGQLHTEIERVFNIYLSAFEDQQCMERTMCQLGTYSKDVWGKEFILSMVEPKLPEGMKNNVLIFKKAALSGYDTGKCKKYRCLPPKLN